MTQQNQQQAAPFSVSDPLRILADATAETRAVRQKAAERYKAFMEVQHRLQRRLETAETDVRRLNAKLNSVEAENKRLTAENLALMKSQQTMDMAIRVACNDFSETALFFDNATRSTFTVAEDTVHIAPAVDFNPERKQTPSTFRQHAPQEATAPAAPPHAATAPIQLDRGQEPRRDLGRIQPQVAEAPQQPAYIPDDSGMDAIEQMELEIDQMLAGSQAENVSQPEAA